MQRPKFTVVSSLVVALAALGGLARVAVRDLPPEELNRLQYEASEFQRQASRHPVDWRTFGTEAFVEARRSGKPVLLLIGAPWSAAAREADRVLFNDPDAYALLNQRFICVRVDAEEDPAWLSAYLPLTRPRTGILPGLQIWLLDPNGELIDFAPGLGGAVAIESRRFLQTLLRFGETFESLQSSVRRKEIPADAQRRDLALLLEPRSPAVPRFDAQDAAVAERVDPRGGGFPQFGRRTPNGAVFHYLLSSGQYELFRSAMRPLVRGKLVDWLDGGFFSAEALGATPKVSFDKIAVQNAEMMQVLAIAGRLLGEALLERLAKATFDSLAGEFQQDGLIAACRMGDERLLGRSERSSFTPRQLRETLDSEERDWARRNLGLRVEENPLMTVVLRDPERTLAQEDRFRRVMEKLSSSRKLSNRFAAMRRLDVNGYVIARLLAVARLWADHRRIALAAELFDRLEWFRAGDDVTRTLEGSLPAQAYLGDYLAYADAALQDFLATGRTLSFERGISVLKRAKFLFEQPRPGIWMQRIKPLPQPGPQDSMVPEVLDWVRESCTAQAIRLTNAYGRLARGSQSATAASLSQAARTAVEHAGPLAEALAFFGSGYFSASLEVLDDAHAVSVGPNAQELANDLYERVPTRLIAPARGIVRSDLQRMEPGVYVVEGLRSDGPLSVDEAAGRLSATLRQ